MQKEYHTPKTDNTYFDIYKEVAIRRTKIGIGQQGSNFDLKRLNTDKSSPIKRTKLELFQNYELNLQGNKKWINSTKHNYKNTHK